MLIKLYQVNPFNAMYLEFKKIQLLGLKLLSNKNVDINKTVTPQFYMNTLFFFRV